MTGRVARWFPKYHYGFITSDEDGVDYHVEARNVKGGVLENGQRVRFAITNDWAPGRRIQNGWIAVDVELLAAGQETPRG